MVSQIIIVLLYCFYGFGFLHSFTCLPTLKSMEFPHFLPKPTILVCSLTLFRAYIDVFDMVFHYGLSSFNGLTPLSHFLCAKHGVSHRRSHLINGVSHSKKSNPISWNTMSNTSDRSSRWNIFSDPWKWKPFNKKSYSICSLVES